MPINIQFYVVLWHFRELFLCCSAADGKLGRVTHQSSSPYDLAARVLVDNLGRVGDEVSIIRRTGHVQNLEQCVQVHTVDGAPNHTVYSNMRLGNRGE